MAERFRDSIKAAQYLSQGLHHDFPDAELEVIRLQKGKPKHSVCPIDQAERVLVEACKGLEAVSVDYHPANKRITINGELISMEMAGPYEEEPGTMLGWEQLGEHRHRGEHVGHEGDGGEPA